MASKSWVSRSRPGDQNGGACMTRSAVSGDYPNTRPRQLCRRGPAVLVVDLKLKCNPDAAAPVSAAGMELTQRVHGSLVEIPIVGVDYYS
jgi:hypothetical protein